MSSFSEDSGSQSEVEWDRKKHKSRRKEKKRHDDKLDNVHKSRSKKKAITRKKGYSSENEYSSRSEIEKSSEEGNRIGMHYVNFICRTSCLVIDDFISFSFGILNQIMVKDLN